MSSNKAKTNLVFTIWKKYPVYKKLQYSGIITGLGSWVSFIAMLVLLASITDNGVQLGTLWAVSGLAPLLFSAFTGVFADRIDLRKAIIYSDIIKAILFLGYLVIPLLDGIYAWVLFFILRFIIGILNTFTSTAIQTAIPHVIKKDDLIVANSLSYTITSTIRLGGASIGGVLVSILGIEYIWIVTSIMYLLSALIIGSEKWNTKEKIKSSKNFKEEFKIGLQIAKNNIWVRLILLSAFSIGTIIGSFNLMLEQFPSNIYGIGSYGISILYISEGLISILLGYWVAKNKFMFKKVNNYGYIYMMVGLAWMSFGFSTNIILGSLSLMLFAFFATLLAPFERYALQTQVPEHAIGRIFGLWNTSTLASIQMGAFITGLIISFWGLKYVPMITGLLEAIVGAIFLLSTKSLNLIETETGTGGQVPRPS